MVDIFSLTDEEIDMLVDAVLEEVESGVDDVLALLSTEFREIYDQIITSYYKYSTHSYVRHGESSPGTGQGSNLYASNKIPYSLDVNADHMRIEIGEDITSEGMMGYDRIRKDGSVKSGPSTEEVLESALEGYHGVQKTIQQSVSIDSFIFGHLSGMPEDIIEMINDEEFQADKLYELIEPRIIKAIINFKF